MVSQNNSSFTNEVSIKNITYWQSQLSNAVFVTNFPSDRPRSSDRLAKTPNAFNKIDLTISEKIVRGLQDLAESRNVDLESVFLSAYYVLLSRYTNQFDLIIGYFAALKNNFNRKSPSIIPLCLKTESESASFNNLLSYISDRLSGAKQHQDIDTKQLLSVAKSLNSTSQHGLPGSNILFSYSKGQRRIDEKLSNRHLNQKELLLNINLASSQVSLEFDENLFLKETSQRIINNYQRLLEDIVDNPEKQLNTLNLLTESEANLVINQWNQTQVEPELKSVPKLFEIRVANNPQAIALRCQEQQLTYEQLNQKANQVAHYLKTLGVGKNSLVGLCLERSPNMVVGVLGILKTGAAYVPLDRENPVSRLAYILEDSQVAVLLTEDSLKEELPNSGNDLSLVCLDRDGNLIKQQSSENLDIELNPEDLAHVVYTSGSTGKPKGVMITHGNLSHYAHSLQIALNITPDDVYLYRGSIALIVSARQLLMPLAQGAAVSILTTADKKDPLKMFELIKQHGVTIVDRVPSFWRNFSGILNSLSTERRQSLMDNQVRLVAAGGEQVSVEIYQCWRKVFKPEVKLANIYGQTEGTGVVTIYYIPDEIDEHFKSLPVGSPIPNMRVYILDRYLKPVPIGVTGEVHISGRGVAQGYLNRPELTAEKFIDNPFSLQSSLTDEEGRRLYKTGDLGRYLANGTVQFLGRSDRQVNINGLRIELGEIETTLVQHPQILESAVIVKENKLGETLVAYLVPSQDRPNPQAIRSFLLEKLPKYMLPANLIFCDSFPLTASGKIDRNALAIHELEHRQTEYITPRNDIEAGIVQTLEEILDIKQISVQDDFIELGGNSLIAARLVTEIENQYGQIIPISSVFQSPTPQALAELIAQEKQNSTSKSLIPIKQGKSQPILFGIHNLGYGLELYRSLAKHLGADISLYGLSSFFSNEPNLPHPRDISGLASYYAHQLQLVQPKGPYHLMGVSFGGVIAYETAQRLVSQGNEVKFLGLIDTFIPNQNSITSTLPLKERIFGHINKIRTKGASHVLNRIEWRIGATMDDVRAKLYEIDWIKENFADKTSRNFAQAEYVQQRKEHQQVNQNYAIKPYSGHVSMFRATDDMDSKLGWRELAKSGLSIHDVPGEHLEVLQEPNVQILAQKLTLAVEKPIEILRE